MRTQVARRAFTVDEYHRMAVAGILSGDDRVELIDGEIVRMSPLGSGHAACVDRLNALLGRRSELQPDRVSAAAISRLALRVHDVLG